MKKAIRFIPILLLFYLPFHVYNWEAAAVIVPGSSKKPVDIELSGYYDDNHHESILIWSASACLSNSSFIIERKEDSSAYHQIDRVHCIQPANGPGNYDYVDNSDVSKYNSVSYRIAYQAAAEIKSYSNELQLSPNGNSGFQSVQLYPNPAANDFVVSFNTPIEDGEVVVYDLLGTEQARKPFRGFQQKLFFDCSGWDAGIYNLVIFAGDNQLQLRLSVRRMQI